MELKDEFHALPLGKGSHVLKLWQYSSDIIVIQVFSVETSTVLLLNIINPESFGQSNGPRYTQALPDTDFATKSFKMNA
jgi:hypothetical protein